MFGLAVLRHVLCASSADSIAGAVGGGPDAGNISAWSGRRLGGLRTPMNWDRQHCCQWDRRKYETLQHHYLRCWIIRSVSVRWKRSTQHLAVGEHDPLN